MVYVCSFYSLRWYFAHIYIHGPCRLYYNHDKSIINLSSSIENPINIHYSPIFFYPTSTKLVHVNLSCIFNVHVYATLNLDFAYVHFPFSGVPHKTILHSAYDCGGALYLIHTCLFLSLIHWMIYSVGMVY